jgi:acetyl esterase
MSLSADLAVEVQRHLARRVLRAPPALLRRLAGRPVRSPEGYLLDVQTQALLRADDALGSTSWVRRPLAEARAAMDRACRILQARPRGALDVKDLALGRAGAPPRARVYVPQGGRAPRPTIVYFHGGGFVLGSLASHDGECRALALATGAIVVAVDYRLAPEDPFPAALDDALTAFRAVAERLPSMGGDTTRIAVAGDSAGGNLAAVVARETRGDAIRPIHQLLVYPAVDFTRSFASHRHFREGFLLEEDAIDWYLESYAGGRDPRDPRLSPLFADDPGGVPPATILTAGFDPLRDEGEAYAKRLEAAGVPVRYRCHEGLVHGFWSLTAGVDAARRAVDEAHAWLREAFAS